MSKKKEQTITPLEQDLMDEVDVEQLELEDAETTGVEENIEDIPYQHQRTAPRRVQTQPYDYAVRSLMDLIVDEDLIINPEYQRKYRWDDTKASSFVESLILNIPVPVLYLSEEPDTKLIVIDGQQRLASLLRFTKPDELDPLFSSIPLEPLTLTGLRVRDDLNGKTFRDLSYEDRNALQKRHIRCIVILNESDPMLKFEVFERLNTGSVQLTDQEVRNCIYGGSFNNLLLQAAKNSKYQELIALPSKLQSNMKDTELVLRFFAYRDLPDSYNGGYTEYLNEYMEENRKISSARSAELLELFNKTIETVYEILTPGIAFRRPGDRKAPSNGQWSKSYINGAIYESQMIVYSCLPSLDQLSKEQIENIRTATYSVFAANEYWGSIFQGTARKKRVVLRTKELYKSISKVINLSSLTLINAFEEE